jgi:hypothetical protein
MFRCLPDGITLHVTVPSVPQAALTIRLAAGCSCRAVTCPSWSLPQKQATGTALPHPLLQTVRHHELHRAHSVSLPTYAAYERANTKLWTMCNSHLSGLSNMSASQQARLIVVNPTGESVLGCPPTCRREAQLQTDATRERTQATDATQRAVAHALTAVLGPKSVTLVVFSRVMHPRHVYQEQRQPRQ